MRIRSLFLVCMIAVAALGTSLGGWMLTLAIMEFQVAGRVQQTVEVDSLVFDALDKIGVERPFVGDALLRAASVSAAVRTELKAVRDAADDALTRVQRRVAETRGPGAARQSAILRQTRDDLGAWRANVDRTLEQPKDQRDPSVFAQDIVRLNRIFDAATTVLDLGDMDAALHDGTSVELMALARSAWSLRVMTGVRTVPLMAAIDAARSLGPDKLAEQARFDGALDATWDPVLVAARRLSAFPAITAAIDQAHAVALAQAGLCHLVIAAPDGRYPISAYGLGRTVVNAARVILGMRDAALDTARRRVADSRRAALLHLAIAAAVLLSIVLAVLIVPFVLRRRIVAPLLAMTFAIDRIARLDFGVAIPGLDRTDEIGRMARALDALRIGAMAGEANKARIEHLARHDALTGLANRLALQERLEQAIALAGRGQKAALLCLDLDRFKAVNDTFGHATGDLLLRAVAERVLACVREVDTVSRIGGDEFVVLLDGVDSRDQAIGVAERIAGVLGEPFELDGNDLRVGCSIGIAMTPGDASLAGALLKCADTALYRAKQEQKGSWRFFVQGTETRSLGRAGPETQACAPSGVATGPDRGSILDRTISIA